MAGEKFGRKIAGRSRGSLPPARDFLERACQVEIGEFQFPRITQEHILEFEVEEQDVIVVKVLECAAELGGRRETPLLPGLVAAPDPVEQVFSLDEFEGGVGAALETAARETPHDVRMVEPTHQIQAMAKLISGAGMHDPAFAEDAKDDLPVIGRSGEVDPRKTSRVDQLLQQIAFDPIPGGRHRFGFILMVPNGVAKARSCSHRLQHMSERRPSWQWWWVALAVPVVLAPPAFWLVRWIAGAVAGPEWLEEATFARVFQRLLTVGGLGVAIPWFLARGVRDRNSLGLSGDGRLRQVSLGLWLGLVVVVLQMALHLSTGARDWEPDLGWGDIGRIAMAATFAAAFEEILFRGALLGMMLRGMAPAAAIWVQAVVFSTAHFLKPPGFGEGYGVHFGSGFELLAAIPSLIAAWPARWLTLALLGAVLGAMAVRRGNVWWCIGFHWMVAAGAMILPKLTEYEGGAWRAMCAKDVSAGFDGVLLLALALLVVWPRLVGRGSA